MNQTYPHVAVTVIFRDSGDNTEVILGKYKDHIRVIKQDGENPANARNAGIEHCTGKYVAFCDADDLFDVEKTEKQVKFIKEHDVDLVYSDFYLLDHKGDLIDKIRTPEWDFKTWLRSGYIAFSTVMVKRDVLVKAKCFDERWSSSEDFDLLIRLSQHAEFKRIPEYLASRRIHKGNLSRSVFETLLSRSKIYLSHGYPSLAISSFIRGIVFSHLRYVFLDHPRLYTRARKLLKVRRD